MLPSSRVTSMRKFKLDENLPAGLVNDLRVAGYDATSVADEGMNPGRKLNLNTGPVGTHESGVRPARVC